MKNTLIVLVELTKADARVKIQNHEETFKISNSKCSKIHKLKIIQLQTELYFIKKPLIQNTIPFIS